MAIRSIKWIYDCIPCFCSEVQPSKFYRGSLWRCWQPLPDYLHQLAAQKLMWAENSVETPAWIFPKVNLCDLFLLIQTTTLMLWAAPTNHTRMTKRSGVLTSSSLISGPQLRAPCLPPETAASVPFCSAKSASASGASSSQWYERTDYKLEAFVMTHTTPSFVYSSPQ